MAMKVEDDSRSSTNPRWEGLLALSDEGLNHPRQSKQNIEQMQE